MNSLCGLSSKYENAEDALHFINMSIDEHDDLKKTHQTPGMIQNKLMYIVGLLDAFYYAEKISIVEYNQFYRCLGL